MPRHRRPRRWDEPGSTDERHRSSLAAAARFSRLDGSAVVADAGYEADLVSAIEVPASATRGMLGRLFGR
jgi:hypothetical protein